MDREEEIKLMDDLEPSKDFDEIAEDIIGEKKGNSQPRNTPQRMMMKKGMPINFYGCKYKVIAVKKNGRVVLQFKGFLKEKRQV